MMGIHKELVTGALEQLCNTCMEPRKTDKCIHSSRNFRSGCNHPTSPKLCGDAIAAECTNYTCNRMETCIRAFQSGIEFRVQAEEG